MAAPVNAAFSLAEKPIWFGPASKMGDKALVSADKMPCCSPKFCWQLAIRFWKKACCEFERLFICCDGPHMVSYSSPCAIDSLASAHIPSVHADFPDNMQRRVVCGRPCNGWHPTYRDRGHNESFWAKKAQHDLDFQPA